jgi:hypothetical protein
MNDIVERLHAQLDITPDDMELRGILADALEERGWPGDDDEVRYYRWTVKLGIAPEHSRTCLNNRWRKGWWRWHRETSTIDFPPGTRVPEEIERDWDNDNEWKSTWTSRWYKNTRRKAEEYLAKWARKCGLLK